MGDFYKDDALPGFHLEVAISKKCAVETKAKIEKDSAGAVDSSYSIVIVIPVTSGNEDKMVSTLTTLCSDPEYEGKVLKGLRKDVAKGKANFKITKADGKVIFSIGMPEPMQ